LPISQLRLQVIQTLTNNKQQFKLGLVQQTQQIIIMQQPLDLRMQQIITMLLRLGLQIVLHIKQLQKQALQMLQVTILQHKKVLQMLKHIKQH
jgi:hypothetical protein